MLSELNQLLTCRREREDRAAQALRRARSHHAALLAEVALIEEQQRVHEQGRHDRESKLYRHSTRRRLTTYQIDDLNIELDLMAEEADALMAKRQAAEAKVEAAAEAVEKATATYRTYRTAGDRWQSLFDDVAEHERLEQDQAEEFAAEDELGDRQAAVATGEWRWT